MSYADDMIQDHLDRLMDAGEPRQRPHRRKKKKRNEQHRKNLDKTPQKEVPRAVNLPLQAQSKEHELHSENVVCGSDGEEEGCPT